MAIEAREFTEKDELIAKLKKVSNGLSVIAQEKQKISDAKKEVEELRAKTEQEQSDFSQKKEAGEKRIAEAKKEITYYEQKITDLKNERKEIEEDAPKLYANFNWKLWLASFALMLLAILTGVFYFIKIYLSLPGYRDISGGAMAIIILICLIIVILVPTLLAISDTNKKGVANKNSALEEIDAEIKETENLLDGIRCVYPNLEKDYEKIVSSEPSDFNLKMLETKVNGIIIPTSSKKIQEVKDKLYKEVAILTERDWEKADDAIYYLKTGRVASLAEALLVIDERVRQEQLRTAITVSAQNLVFAMNRLTAATEYSGKQINKSYEETARKFEQSYSDMKYALRDIGDQVSSQLSNLSSAVESQGRAIADAEKANLEQANRSSDELMYELRYNQKYWQK